MNGVKEITYKPIPEKQAVYQDLYKLYKQLHDTFGLTTSSGSVANVMKQLLSIKEGTDS